MPADSDCTKSPVKQCRQVGHSAPTNEVGVGPGRPELHVDPARQVRPLKLDAAPKVSKQPSAVPGVTSKKVDKRVQQPTNGAVKGSSRSTSTAWK